MRCRYDATVLKARPAAPIEEYTDGPSWEAYVHYIGWGKRCVDGRKPARRLPCLSAVPHGAPVAAHDFALSGPAQGGRLGPRQPGPAALGAPGTWDHQFSATLAAATGQFCSLQPDLRARFCPLLRCCSWRPREDKSLPARIW